MFRSRGFGLKVSNIKDRAVMAYSTGTSPAVSTGAPQQIYVKHEFLHQYKLQNKISYLMLLNSNLLVTV